MYHWHVEIRSVKLKRRKKSQARGEMSRAGSCLRHVIRRLYPTLAFCDFARRGFPKCSAALPQSYYSHNTDLVGRLTGLSLQAYGWVPGDPEVVALHASGQAYARHGSVRFLSLPESSYFRPSDSRQQAISLVAPTRRDLTATSTFHIPPF